MDDYKKYSLEQLDNWIHDAISCSEATPQEIYDTIRKAIEEEYYVYKHRTSQAYELLALLNGNGKGHLTYDKENKVKKWVLPVEMDDSLSGECYVSLPDDLLDAIGIKEGDQITWIDNGDGSFSFRKFKTHDEMIAEGWSMTDDGFWIKES